MNDQPLFKMNEHGDIWQEPTLFDQGGTENPTSSCADAHRAALEAHAAMLEVPGPTPAPLFELDELEGPADELELEGPSDDRPARRLPNGRTRAEIRDYIKNGPRRP